MRKNNFIDFPEYSPFGEKFCEPNQRLKEISPENMEVGKSLETTLGKELIIKRKKSPASFIGGYDLTTVLKINVGEMHGILETKYSELNDNEGDFWYARHIKMTSYFPGDERYAELKTISEDLE